MLGNVLVTGGAGGLGAAVVEAVREAGGVPLVLDKSAPSTADFELVDLSDGRAAEAAVAKLAERHGGFSGVVTAAGIELKVVIDQFREQIQNLE